MQELIFADLLARDVGEPVLERLALGLGLLEVLQLGHVRVGRLGRLEHALARRRAAGTTTAATAKDFAERFKDLPCKRVGLVTKEPRLRVKLGMRTLLDADVMGLKAAWKETLARV